MTATGSVTLWMACGDRPVERAPEPGAFPTVGINQRLGGRAFCSLAAPANGRLADRDGRPGRNPKPETAKSKSVSGGVERALKNRL